MGIYLNPGNVNFMGNGMCQNETDIKKPLQFVVALLSLMIVGSVFTGIYSFSTYTTIATVSHVIVCVDYLETVLQKHSKRRNTLRNIYCR